MELGTLVLEKLAEKRIKNPSYSLRAFSKRLGVSSGALSQIVAGKRPLTRKTALKIAEGLNLDSDTTLKILNSVEESGTSQKSQKIAKSFLQSSLPREVYVLRQDELYLISELIHFDIYPEQ